MSQRYDPSRHHRRSIRLKRYDYTQPWAYFVTICTVQRAHLFGDVVDGEMRLSEYGVIVREEWFRLAEIRQEIELYEDELVLMPNHIHGIVWIVEEHEGAHGIGGVYGIGVGVHGSAPQRYASQQKTSQRVFQRPPHVHCRFQIRGFQADQYH